MSQHESGLDIDEIFSMLDEPSQLKIFVYIVEADHHYESYLESLRKILETLKEKENKFPSDSKNYKTLHEFILNLENFIKEIPSPYKTLESSIPKPESVT
jgi:hypothetical protein